MSASLPIQTLVDRFTSQWETYQQKYNEAQTRIDFINPLFTALGWDVNNEQGLPETSRPVVHEDVLRIGRATKMPDYSFRIGGIRKFFVEAKKPSINLKTDPEPAFQVRRYGWNAKLSLSIVTNFAEFAVYDCRLKPSQTDKASTARLWYLRYTDYLKEWEKLVEYFSFDAVWQGSLEKYLTQQGTPKGVLTVDAAFLKEMEGWRERLAQNIVSLNPHLTSRQINVAVQQTLDRIVFLRICEDRGIEDYGRLLTLTNGPHIYPRLFQLFHQADERYNSGLFHFKAEAKRGAPDNLTPTLRIDDSVLIQILKHLYYPNSPYEFSVFPADILGQVYEQFLGKVIRLTSARQAVVEEKPEVKKAGGVYYTPTYIVDYIVKQTVGKLVAGKTVDEVSRLTILDPACGSGSFLLGAYQFLLSWHLEQYLTSPEKWAKGKKPRLYQARGGLWKLTTMERKRILLNNLYGVDIDTQAVEVTKLSLLLKVLEDEQSVISQLSLFREQVLPDLENNIKCGNSLIGTDFYAGQQPGWLNEETLYRVNAFDWEKGFVAVRKGGGFDAVIGNPPYVRQELLGEAKSYFQDHYQVFHGVADLYVYFLEKGVSLLREKGFFGMIVSNKWLRANYGKPLRQWLTQRRLVELTDFGDLPVFSPATTYPCILMIQQSEPSPTVTVSKVNTLAFEELSEYVKPLRYEVATQSLTTAGWSLANPQAQALLEKLQRAGVPLGEYVKGQIYRGILTGLNEAFVIDAKTREKLIAKDSKSAELIKPFLLGRDIKRYQPLTYQQFLIFTRRGVNIDQYPAIKQYLRRFKKSLTPKPQHWQGETWAGRKPGSYQWYEIQDAVDYYQEFEKPKIIYLVFQVKPAFTYDDKGTYGNNATWIIPGKDHYLLGVLNSKLGWFLISHYCTQIQNGYQLIFQYLVRIPIKRLDFQNPAEKAKHDRIVLLVTQILDLNKRLATALDSHSKTVLKRQMEAIDEEIDKVVYEVYNLTPEEIEIVEKS
jgi:Eco57I restriction-modification methylase/TaqI-like C-terminal specificity domain/N-6 DNA Methylase